MNNQDPNSEVETSAVKALGNLLRQARVHKGLSVGEVAERLKLPNRQIDAMENGCYQDLPEEVFIKGFITTYARFLDLDGDEVQHYLQQIFPKSMSKYAHASDKAKVSSKDLNFQNMPVRKTIPRWVLAVIIVAIIGGVVYVWQGKSSAESAKQAATASQEVSAQASSAAVISASNVRVVPMTANDLPVAATTSAASMASSPNNVGGAVVGVNANQLTNNQMMISADHSSWLQISDKNDVVLLNKVVNAGFSQQFAGGAPYRLIIGYAPGIHVKFNGQDVNIPQTNKRTAVLTVGQ